MAVVRVIVILLRASLFSRAVLAAEILALRHQLGVLHRSVKRPHLRQRDRIFWVWLSRIWAGWCASLIIVKPETVVRWHRDGFRLYWRWKSRKKPGRPMIDAVIRRVKMRLDMMGRAVGHAAFAGREQSASPRSHVVRYASAIVSGPSQPAGPSSRREPPLCLGVFTIRARVSPSSLHTTPLLSTPRLPS